MPIGGGRMRNGMLKGERLRVAILLIGLTALLLTTACAPRPHVEEKQVVKVGYVACLTGPAAAIMQVGWRNLVDYLKYFEEVGVPGLGLPPGVTIEVVWGDTGMEATRAISVYERIRSDVVFWHIPDPVSAHALKSRLERDEIAAMTMVADEVLMYPPGWFFTVFCTESERFAAWCDWIMENWEEERQPIVGMMGTDTPSGRAAEVMGTAYAKSVGIEMLPFEHVPYTPLDVSPQLLRLAESGADFIYMQAHWGTSPPIMRDADRLGLVGKIGFAGATEDGLAIPLLELGAAVEGLSQTKCFPWYEEVPIVYDIFREYDGRLDTQGGVACTLQYGPLPIEAINIAIEQVGYENLDGRAVKEAFYSIKDFDPHEIGRPVSYTPEDNRGAPGVRIYEIRGGKVVPANDWREAPMLVPVE
jgi:ABC-type branched-subunit amino acid transport system substrate-binding protein